MNEWILKSLSGFLTSEDLYSSQDSYNYYFPGLLNIPQDSLCLNVWRFLISYSYIIWLQRLSLIQTGLLVQCEWWCPDLNEIVIDVWEFTKEELNNSFAFLYTRFIRKVDGSIKSTMCRKKIHRDQVKDRWFYQIHNL